MMKDESGFHVQDSDGSFVSYYFNPDDNSDELGGWFDEWDN